MPESPEQRSLHARMAAHALWAKTDAREHTKPARAAFLARFEKQVDPDGVLDPAERARRAEHAKRAHMARLSMKAAARRRSA